MMRIWILRRGENVWCVTIERNCGINWKVAMYKNPESTIFDSSIIFWSEDIFMSKFDGGKSMAWRRLQSIIILIQIDYRAHSL